MILPILKIRYRQLTRIMEGLGLMRVVFLAGLSAFAGFVLFLETVGSPESLYATGVCLAIITAIQVNRRDKTFLKINFLQYRLVFLIEYLFLLVPLFGCLVYHHQWIAAIPAIPLVLLITGIDYRPGLKSINSVFQRLIPWPCFELKSGVRTSLFLVIPVWIAGLGSSFFIGGVPVALFILGMLPLGFYEKGESIEMLLASEMSSGRFILEKIKMQLFLFTALASPLIAAFVIFHTAQWYIAVIEYIVLISSHVFIVLTKYTFYQPNQKSGGAQVFGLLGAIGMIIPVFIPLIWILSVRFYFKSRENLNFYLDDYN